MSIDSPSSSLLIILSPHIRTESPSCHSDAVTSSPGTTSYAFPSESTRSPSSETVSMVSSSHDDAHAVAESNRTAKAPTNSFTRMVASRALPNVLPVLTHGGGAGLGDDRPEIGDGGHLQFHEAGQPGGGF